MDPNLGELKWELMRTPCIVILLQEQLKHAWIVGERDS